MVACPRQHPGGCSTDPGAHRAWILRSRYELNRAATRRVLKRKSLNCRDHQSRKHRSWVAAVAQGSTPILIWRQLRIFRRVCSGVDILSKHDMGEDSTPLGSCTSISHQPLHTSCPCASTALSVATATVRPTSFQRPVLADTNHNSQDALCLTAAHELLGAICLVTSRTRHVIF